MVTHFRCVLEIYFQNSLVQTNHRPKTTKGWLGNRIGKVDCFTCRICIWIRTELFQKFNRLISITVVRMQSGVCVCGLSSYTFEQKWHYPMKMAEEHWGCHDGLLAFINRGEGVHPFIMIHRYTNQDHVELPTVCVRENEREREKQAALLLFSGAGYQAARQQGGIITEAVTFLWFLWFQHEAGGWLWLTHGCPMPAWKLRARGQYMTFLGHFNLRHIIYSTMNLCIFQHLLLKH